jgi:hypothetical protein
MTMLASRQPPGSDQEHWGQCPAGGANVAPCCWTAAVPASTAAATALRSSQPRAAASAKAPSAASPAPVVSTTVTGRARRAETPAELRAMVDDAHADRRVLAYRCESRGAPEVTSGILAGKGHPPRVLGAKVSNGTL